MKPWEIVCNYVIDNKHFKNKLAYMWCMVNESYILSLIVVSIIISMAKVVNGRNLQIVENCLFDLLSCSILVWRTSLEIRWPLV